MKDSRVFFQRMSVGHYFTLHEMSFSQKKHVIMLHYFYFINEIVGTAINITLKFEVIIKYRTTFLISVMN